MTILNTTQISW